MGTEAAAPRRGRPPNPQLRARILSAALELFAERGYDATSVNQVVIRAGVTKGALYHYFAAKEDLLYEIYRGLLDQQLADLDRICAEEPDPSHALRAVIRDLVVSTIRYRRAVTVFSRESARLSPERWHALQRDWRRYQEVVRGLIRDAQRRGTFNAVASPELVSWMIFGLTTGLPSWYRPDGPKSPSDIADEASEFVLAALSPDHIEGMRAR
ncbi:MAG TPA: TetR/AcrR family transcriptional regulator [Jiangellaceae bacterium]|nr:TetR/AcrR family transcriptional regulator [Jiangellaceae bacterium]